MWYSYIFRYTRENFCPLLFASHNYESNIAIASLENACSDGTTVDCLLLHNPTSLLNMSKSCWDYCKHQLVM